MSITDIRELRRKARVKAILKLLSNLGDSKMIYFSINSTFLWIKQERMSNLLCVFI